MERHTWLTRHCFVFYLAACWIGAVGVGLMRTLRRSRADTTAVAAAAAEAAMFCG